MNNNEYIFKVFDKMEHGTAFDYRLNNDRMVEAVKDDRNFEELIAVATDFLMQISVLRATCKQSLQVQPPHIVIRDPVIPWKCGCGKPGCRYCGKAEGSEK